MKNIYKVLLVMTFVFSLAASVCAQTANIDVGPMFSQANEVYKEGDYQEARALYESIVESGKVSGAVYYNLGNSYFKTDDLGHAILSYQRAKRLIPRDSDLDANYKYALSFVKNGNKALKKNFFEKLLSRHIAFYTLDEMVIICFILVLFFIGCHIFSLFRRWPMRRTAVCLSIVAILLIIYGFGFYVACQNQSGQAIVLIDTETKFEPRTGATIHYELYAGSEVRILKQEGDWVKVKRLDEKEGWIRREVLEKI